MKLKYVFLSLTLASLAFYSCEKDDKLSLASTEGFGNAAALKIIHSSAYTVNTAIQLKVNDQRVSSNITYTYPFPGGGFNTGGNADMDYLKVDAAAVKIGMAIPKTGSNVDSVNLFTGSTPALQTNKYYDAFISDTGASTKMLVVEENLSPVAATMGRYRFANLMPNLPSADLYFGTQLVASNVAYNTVSADFTLPKDSSARWAIRPAGTAATTTAIAYYPTSATSVNVVPGGRALTVFARGYNGITTGNRVPAISLFYNYYTR